MQGLLWIACWPKSKSQTSSFLRKWSLTYTVYLSISFLWRYRFRDFSFWAVVSFYSPSRYLHFNGSPLDKKPRWSVFSSGSFLCEVRFILLLKYVLLKKYCSFIKFNQTLTIFFCIWQQSSFFYQFFLDFLVVIN